MNSRSTETSQAIREELDLFLLLVVFSLPFAISQVGTDSFASALKASLMPPV
jgi:hypothetical protein